MSAQTTELDPAAIRIALTIHRSKRTDWPVAWADATGHHRTSADERGMYLFMERHFRAAYYDTPSSLGRCAVDEPDVSGAVVRRPAHAPVPLKPGRCRSGDGCDRLATRGRFGPTFCEHHGAELDRIGLALADARGRADPRNSGNTSLFTHKAA